MPLGGGGGGGGGARIVTVALPLFPEVVALMVVVPAVSAVITPVDETVASDGFALLQTKVWPVTGLPDAS
jgi:hypothetical protein